MFIDLAYLKKNLLSLGIPAKVDGRYFSGGPRRCLDSSITITFKNLEDKNLFKLLGNYADCEFRLKISKN